MLIGIILGVFALILLISLIWFWRTKRLVKVKLNQQQLQILKRVAPIDLLINWGDYEVSTSDFAQITLHYLSYQHGKAPLKRLLSLRAKHQNTVLKALVARQSALLNFKNNHAQIPIALQTKIKSKIGGLELYLEKVITNGYLLSRGAPRSKNE